MSSAQGSIVSPPLLFGLTGGLEGGDQLARNVAGKLGTCLQAPTPALLEY